LTPLLETPVLVRAATVTPARPVSTHPSLFRVVGERAWTSTLIAHRGRTMSRSRLAIAALVTVVVVAAGIAAGVAGTRRPAAAIVTTTPSPTTAQDPASTVSTSLTGTTAPHATTTMAPRAGTTVTTNGHGGEPTRISDPARAAAHPFDAWQAGNRGLALEFASAPAVRTLFAIAPTPRPRFSGCRSRALGFDCFYQYTDADGVLYLDMRVTGGASAGYRVVSVAAPLRFASPQSSAKHLLDSWRAGDRTAALQAASSEAVDAMFRLADRQHPPTPDGCTFLDKDHGFQCVDLVDGGRLNLRVVGGASIGWTVASVTKVSD
jgi:hypothetical protein